MKKLLKTLLGTSLYLLEQSDGAHDMRDRGARKIDDFRDLCSAEVRGCG
jgi:hypothetical protein